MFRCLQLLITSVLFSAVAAAQCSFTLSHTNQSFGPNGGSGDVIVITASSPTCQRTVTSNVPWVTVDFGQTGTGNGTAGYTVQANRTASQRQGTLNVAGRTFLVTQSAGSCQYTLTPATATAAPNGGEGIFEVASACAWSATTADSWVTVSGSGTGNGAVSWKVAANQGGTDRTATIRVGTSSFTLRQTGGCVFTTTSSVVTATSAGGSFTVPLQGRDGCERRIDSAADWITITSGATGEGSGSLGITVTPNSTRNQRTGTIRVNGAALIEVRQAGSTCNVQLSPRFVTLSAEESAGSLAVNAPCAWTVSRPDVDWVRLTGTTSGSGAGTVSYVVGRNGSSLARGTTLRINEAEFVIQQAAGACTLNVAPTSFNFGSSGGSDVLSVTGVPGCTWTASSDSPWISITRGASGGIGDGEVAFAVAPNDRNRARSGLLLVAGQTISVRQSAGQCTFALVGESRIQTPATGLSGNIELNSTCSWVASSSAGWLDITGTTPKSLSWTARPNTEPAERVAVITMVQTDSDLRLSYTVTQSGQRCTVTSSSAALSLPPRGGQASLDISGTSTCTWIPVSTASWLSVVDYAAVDGSGTVRLSAAPNITGSTRTAAVGIAGTTIVVQQPPLILEITSAGVVNAATFASGPIAPGEIVTLFGSGFGPTNLSKLQLGSDGRVSTELAQTRVFFNGAAAPLIYAAEGQISAIVPYGVASKPDTNLVIEYLGLRSVPLRVPVAAASPGVFTLSATGRGPAAVLNQDFTLNTAATPASPGSILQIYATGTGMTTPASAEDRLNTAPLQTVVAPVRVLVGETECPVVYAGAAPDSVSGLTQVNVRLPQDSPTGTNLPLTLIIGDIRSPLGPTLAVR